MINLLRQTGVAFVMALLAASASAAELPEKYRDSIRTAASLGMTLFAHDSAASRASDALVEEGIMPRDKRIRGWLTFVADDRRSVAVTFIGEGRGNPVALYLVVVPMFEGNNEIRTLERPEPLTAALLLRWRARMLAIQEFDARKDLCSEHYNTVVFPYVQQGEETILVYFLAATNDSGVVVAGGHYRYELSADGRQIKSKRAFTKACLEIPLNEQRSKSAGLVLTHLLDRTPTEIHVYLSRAYSQPVFVTTTMSALSWKIDGPKIELMSKDE